MTTNKIVQMIKYIKAEDFVSINLKKIENKNTPLNISGKDINLFKDRLRHHGVMCDLGIKELQTISYKYPDNIKVTHTSIQIIGTESFVRHFKLRRKELRKTRLKNIIDLLEE